MIHGKGLFLWVEKIPQKYKYRSAGACRCRKDHTVGGTVICHRADPCAGACGSSGCISGYGCAGAGAWNYDFSKQARLRLNSEPSVGVEVPLRGAQRQSQPTNESSHGESSVAITILDTPGHVDFSAEMERTLQVLDYAILVISGTDGVQGHTRTLWRLLRHYHIPTFCLSTRWICRGRTRKSCSSS